MDFGIPQALRGYLAELDGFIERETKPLKESNAIRFLDHTRENARTDWDHDRVPCGAWEDLLQEARHRADLLVPGRVVGKA